MLNTHFSAHRSSPLLTRLTNCISVAVFSYSWSQWCWVLILHLVISLFSVPVGAELLSILDETENGFIWEHIQSYAEQAYGAWLGISVKGRAAHLLPPLSTTAG